MLTATRPLPTKPVETPAVAVFAMTDTTGETHLRDIRQAVDRLTQPLKLPLILDDGTLTYGVVPSLGTWRRKR